jgi:vancomycin permeability regulator SanA
VGLGDGSGLVRTGTETAQPSHAAAAFRLGAVRAKSGIIAGLALRGWALFVALFLAVGIVGVLRSRTLDPSLWLLDLHDVAGPIRLVGLGLAAVLLAAWALLPSTGRVRRWATGIACLLLAVLALRDVLGFVSAVGAGGVRPFLPVPLSAVIALAFGGLACAVLARRPAAGLGARPAAAGLAVALVGWGITFPVAQMLFFGTTDYRRPADAVVVFGARVYASGVPSQVLQDRIDTAVGLYNAGLVPVIVMSGGDGADGFNEAVVMRQTAIDEGVPAGAVMVDGSGVSTEATVANMAALVAGGQVALPHGELIAVSQAYHLPRVQLAFAAAGIDVLTVPAYDATFINEMPILIGREVLAFWAYDLRTCLG